MNQCCGKNKTVLVVRAEIRAGRRDLEYYNIIMLYINSHRLIITGNVRPDTAPVMRLQVTDSGESRANKGHSGWLI